MSYQQRLKKLQHAIQGLPCDALLIDDTTNLFYLTGLYMSAGKLIVHAKGACLLVDSRYFESCEKVSLYPVLLADPTNRAFKDFLAQTDLAINKLAFNTDTTSYKGFLDLQKVVQEVIVEDNGKKSLELVPVDNPVAKLRAIKDEQEIPLLRAAAELGSQGFDFICTLLREGITEAEIAIELEIFWKQRGSRSISFDPIIAFGVNSSMPHYRAGHSKLKAGDTVLIDIGVNCQHYHSDMTRVVFFQKADPQILEIYSIVRQAQEAALALCRPGALVGDVERAARGFIEQKGFGDKFTHSLGHGIGLEVHEFPALRNTSPNREIILQPGMAITIEPGIYLPGLGGVRLEDTIIITQIGYENLTRRSLEPQVLHS